MRRQNYLRIDVFLLFNEIFQKSLVVFSFKFKHVAGGLFFLTTALVFVTAFFTWICLSSVLNFNWHKLFFRMLHITYWCLIFIQNSTLIRKPSWMAAFYSELMACFFLGWVCKFSKWHFFVGELSVVALHFSFDLWFFSVIFPTIVDFPQCLHSKLNLLTKT